MEIIRSLYEKYISDSSYVYKSCEGKFIVVLQLDPTTKTNETRTNVVDKAFAKYRAEKAHVVLIINKFDPTETIQYVHNSVYNMKLKYEVGKEVKAHFFDKKLNDVCTGGIHYFKSIECAFYHELYRVKNGVFIEWFDNGQKHIEHSYTYGNLDGLYSQWHPNGQKYLEYEYANGVANGLQSRWHPNGVKRSENYYLNGKLHGPSFEWSCDGEKIKEMNYEHGELVDVCQCFDSNATNV